MQESTPFYLGDFSSRQPVAHSYNGDATVLLKESLNFEARSVYTVKIRATDMAGCVGSSCQVIIVIICIIIFLIMSYNFI